MKHKLAHLRELDAEMRFNARASEQFIAEGQDKALVQLAAAEATLRKVLSTFQDLGIETGPLMPLYADVLAVLRGSKPSAMLQLARVGHRPPRR